MNPILRFCKFNLVGAIGMALQLATLAVLNRALPGHYLFVSAAAVELTLLHNFVWHIHYTWRDRSQPWPAALLRFHLSNGIVSILGNLAIMRLLVTHTRLPLLAANLIAIASCSLANFALGNNWAFAPHSNKPTQKPHPRLAQAILLLVILAACQANAQTPAPALPPEPTPQPAAPPAYHPDPTASYFYRMGVLCGSGATTSSAATKPTVGCGVGMTFVPLPIFVEIGLMGPQANRSYLTGYVSVDANIPLASSRAKYLPSVIAGYSRLFETGHALDYGLAIGIPRLGKPKDDGSSLRIELRDYWTFANPNQHNIMLRIGWMSPEAD